MSKFSRENIKQYLKGANRKTVAAVGTLTVVALSGTALALQQNQTTGANEVPPIYTQVEDHEGRITGLEGRADATEAKVNQNTSDIQVIQGQTGIAPSTPTQSPSGGSTAPTINPAPTPEPTPEPVKDPRYIVAVTDTPGSNGLHTCDYTLFDPVQNAKQGLVKQSIDSPCMKVGEVLPY